MAYTIPSIDAYGLHLSSYVDIRDYLIDQAKTIFGADIYLDTDSMDYQYISIVARIIYDNQKILELCYANQSPATAIGTGLSNLVAINGITRNPATYSTVTVLLTGTADTIIENGEVQDINGYTWNLPASVTIGITGTATCTATCATSGTIGATPASINKILTPKIGWIAVTNEAAATIGTNVESDSLLRIRQRNSTASPAQTPLQGTISALLAVSGVTKLMVLENDTSATNEVGVPAHSIEVIIRGGADVDIANTIANHKTAGCGTFGSTSVILDTAYGAIGVINFERPVDNPFNCYIWLDSLVSNVVLKAKIDENIQAFVDTLNFGQTVYASQLYVPVIAAFELFMIPPNENLSITVGTSSPGTTYFTSNVSQNPILVSVVYNA